MASREHVIHTQELEWISESAPDGSAPRERKKLAAAAGGRELGASLYRMGPVSEMKNVAPAPPAAP